jgi:GNAT superfamily N-acetyltransferase
MELTVFPPDVPLPSTLLARVRELFATAYHRYHYLDDIGDPCRLRVVAVAGDEVIGYASATIRSGVVWMANLLVHRDNRGHGVGGALERARYRWARRTGLPSYVSCTCSDGVSQQLKRDLGLRPVAVKLGYRKDVSAGGTHGSSVVYTDADIELATAAVAPRVVADPARRRIRYLGRPADVLETALRADPDHYVDLLVGEHDAEPLYGMPELAFAGVDLDAGSGGWWLCFQSRNNAYREGVAARPVIVAVPEIGLLPALGAMS